MLFISGLLGGTGKSVPCQSACYKDELPQPHRKRHVWMLFQTEDREQRGVQPPDVALDRTVRMHRHGPSAPSNGVVAAGPG
jgi:hypothetical protein